MQISQLRNQFAQEFQTVMVTLQDLQAAIAANASAVEADVTKIAELKNVIAARDVQIAELQTKLAVGSAATAEDLDTLVASVKAVTAVAVKAAA
jgi:hypothetical protein